MTEAGKVQRKARNRMRISLKIKVAVFCFVLLSRIRKSHPKRRAEKTVPGDSCPGEGLENGHSGGKRL